MARTRGRDHHRPRLNVSPAGAVGESKVARLVSRILQKFMTFHEMKRVRSITDEYWERTSRDKWRKGKRAV